jgi:hypothetical protein
LVCVLLVDPAILNNDCEVSCCSASALLRNR